MWRLIVLCVLLLSGFNVQAQFVVVNKTSTTHQFTVVNKVTVQLQHVTSDVGTMHNCPNCGAFQNIVSQMRGNLHSHKCNNCGTEWWHTGNETTTSVPFQQTYSRPSSSYVGCDGGNCNSGYSSQRSSSGWYPGKFLGRR